MILVSTPLVPLTQPPRPSGSFEPEPRLTPGQIADLAETRRAVGIAIDVALQLCVPLAAALLRAGPSAMIAAPTHAAVVADGDAEHLVVLVLPAARMEHCGQVV